MDRNARRNERWWPARLQLLAALACSTALAGLASAEVVIQPSAAPQSQNAEQAKAMVEAQAQAAQAAQQAQADGEKKEGDEEKKEEGDKAEGEADASSIKRPDKPPKIADPRELQAKPDRNNKVQFNFTGQTWPDVLQWLANISGYSLDWTELPNGYLNLATQRSYSLAEARDLINRQLHARGYTLILTGEVLSVYKIDKLDPSLIPRVEEEDLYDLQPHDFVKITFQVPASMEIATAAEDVKKIATEHAKVVPLPASKRLLMISTVANARLVSLILSEERLALDEQTVPDEVPLKYRRAEKIIDTLYVILGLDPASQPSQQELAVQQQKMQLLMQMQGAGKDVSKMLQKEGPQVYLAYNSHRNSIIMNAPAKELKILKRAIAMLDVPAGGETPNELVTDGGARIWRTYKLETMDPSTLASTLEEIGDLNPLTELRADNSAHRLFARASEADHAKIEKVIEQLDDSGMETSVFELRKHPADAVAGTLRGLFAPKKDEDDSRSRRRYGWIFGMNNEEEEEAPEIRVDADIENNRLIVRGSSEQLVQVRDFLTKIGEPLDNPDASNRMRVVEALEPETTARMIQQLRLAWPTIGDNELLIQAPAGSEPAGQPAAVEEPADKAIDQETRKSATADQPFQFVAEEQKAPSATTEGSTSDPSKPPVVIRIAPDGRLLLSSQDAAALDQLEEFIQSATPAPQRFKIFQVKYVTAYSIYLTLQNFYEEELKGDGSDGYFDPYYYEWIPGESAGSPQMSKRKNLQLDWDTASNTILVANASPNQLREIDQLIRVYDKPSADDDAKSRRTAAIKIKYSRASVVAAALKDVYRDLLSTRDKEFETEDKKGASTTRETTTIIRYGSQANSSGDSAKKPTPVKVGFQGALSVGVDEVSNTIIISVQEELFESVLQIVESLDEAAKPDNTVTVHSVNNKMSAEALQKALSEALGTPWVGGKPEVQVQRKNGEGAASKNGQGNQPANQDNGAQAAQPTGE